MATTAPSYKTLTPASSQASRAARGASVKRDTKAELRLRRALWARGIRYRVDVAHLPGRPDIVIGPARVAIFCDGDFWHGRNLGARIRKLSNGHNASYWIAKIRANVARDRLRSRELTQAGWLVLRYWETDIANAPDHVAGQIVLRVRARIRGQRRRTAS